MYYFQYWLPKELRNSVYNQNIFRFSLRTSVRKDAVKLAYRWVVILFDLEDKYKSKYKIQLTPQRHYVSSSSGITGSVYVFPNRSETQKDNIDERLNLAPMAEEGSEFSGRPIRP